MKIIVRGGSTRSDKDKCLGCDHLQRRVDEQGERRICTGLRTRPEVLKFPISECSVYKVKNGPSAYTLEKTAWILRTDGKGTAIGFTKYVDLSKDEQDRLGDTPEPGE